MSDPTYLNFDIVFQKAEGQYHAQVQSPAGETVANFANPFSELELENFVLTATPGRRSNRRIDSPEVAAAKKLGERLFGALFTGDAQGLLRASLNDAWHQESKLRIRLRLTDTPELADLPWEYLYNPALNRFLALDDDTAIVRYLDMPERVRAVTVTLPLRVLVIISNPGDYPRLDVEQEWEHLNDALGGLKQNGLLELDLLEDATLPALRRQLQKSQYHILHFIGHGGFDRQNEEGVLILKSEEGRGRAVSGQQLGWLLHNHKTLSLAILNACEGARADRSDAFAGTAQSLVQQGIPAVVAMQFEITDEAAKTFASAFYSSVAAGRPVEASLTEARLALFAEEFGLEWGTPVLYLRSPDGRIFDIKQLTAEDKRRAQLGAIFAEAQAAMSRRDWAVAAEKVQDLLSQDPTYPQADALLAQVKSEQEKEAKEQEKQKQISALRAEAQKAMAAQDWQLAAQQWQTLLALDPGDKEAAASKGEAERQQQAAALYTSGKRHFEAGRLDQAGVELEKAHALVADYRDVAALVAIIQSRREKERREAAARARRQEPKPHVRADAPASPYDESPLWREMPTPQPEGDANISADSTVGKAKDAVAPVPPPQTVEQSLLILPPVPEETAFAALTVSASDVQPRSRPLWVIPSVIAAVLVVGLLLAWALGLFRSSSGGFTPGHTSPTATSRSVVAAPTATSTGGQQASSFTDACTARQRAKDLSSADDQYFSQTGHNVSGSFLLYLTSYSDLGLPITEAFSAPVPGESSNRSYTQQYFERAILVHHPENRSPYDMLSVNLGALLISGRTFQRSPTPAPGDTAVTYFAETGQSVQGAFKDFFDQKGGLATLGYPLSPEITDVSPADGQSYVMQYFEKTWLQLNGGTVELGDAGTAYLVKLCGK